MVFASRSQTGMPVERDKGLRSIHAWSRVRRVGRTSLKYAPLLGVRSYMAMVHPLSWEIIPSMSAEDALSSQEIPHTYGFHDCVPSGGVHSD